MGGVGGVGWCVCVGGECVWGCVWGGGENYTFQADRHSIHIILGLGFVIGEREV